MTATSSKKPEPYHHGDLKAAVLKRSADIISEKGIEALSLRAVARDLGVSHGAPGMSRTRVSGNFVHINIGNTQPQSINRSSTVEIVNGQKIETIIELINGQLIKRKVVSNAK